MKKVILLGCALETLYLAPFDDETCEIWASGQYQAEVKRFDEWWEIHDVDGLDKPFANHRKWLLEQTKPVVIARPHENIPAGVVHDFRSYIDEWGKEFFTSTVSWMMAKAIRLGYEWIGLYGIEMAANGEYAYQRSGIKFFQKVAEKYHGIKVFIPPGSHLSLEKEPYPFCEETPMAIRIADDKKRVEKELASLKETQRMLSIRAAMAEGAVQAFDKMARMTSWNGWRPTE